jgi:hypothetical protein
VHLGRLPLTNRPFPDQKQLFRSGRTFTFKQANKNDWHWDFAVIPVGFYQRQLLPERDNPPLIASVAGFEQGWPLGVYPFSDGKPK